MMRIFLSWGILKPEDRDICYLSNSDPPVAAGVHVIFICLGPTVTHSGLR